MKNKNSQYANDSGTTDCISSYARTVPPNEIDTYTESDSPSTSPNLSPFKNSRKFDFYPFPKKCSSSKGIEANNRILHQANISYAPVKFETTVELRELDYTKPKKRNAKLIVEQLILKKDTEYRTPLAGPSLIIARENFCDP